MNTVEKLEAAITKLETLRDEGTTREEWSYAPDDAGVMAIVGDAEDMNFGLFAFHPDTIIPATGKHDDDSAVNAELIVTLHRTINAQLATLRFALDQANKSGFEYFDHDHEMLLANAILGGGPNE